MSQSLAEGATKSVCLICERQHISGIFIGHQFMCEMCEEQLVATEANEFRYLFYLNQLTKLNTDQLM